MRVLERAHKVEHDVSIRGLLSDALRDECFGSDR